MKKLMFAAVAAAALTMAPGLASASHCVSNDQCGSSGAGRICRDGNDVWATSKNCPDSDLYPGDIGVIDGEVCGQNPDAIDNETLEDQFPDCD